MKTDREQIHADLDFIRQLTADLRCHFAPYRRIFILWGLFLFIAASLSQVAVYINRSGYIAPIWLLFLFCGFAASALLSRQIRKTEHVTPAMLRQLILLWAGGSALIFIFFLLSFILHIFDLQYIVCLSFPVIALCTLVSASLFNSTTAYIISFVLFLATLPSSLFPEWGFAFQAVIMGGGILLTGIKKE